MGTIRNTRVRVGLLSTIAGGMLVIGSLAIGSVANATTTNERPNDDQKVTICHRTNSVTNPYVVATVDEEAVNGSEEVHGQDHSQHLGSVFDPEADYPTPHNGDQWGDIIPPFYADHSMGNWEPLNWPAGEAIFDNECQVPGTTPTTEPPVTEPPVTQPPVTQPPTTQPTETSVASESPTTSTQVAGEQGSLPGTGASQTLMLVLGLGMVAGGVCFLLLGRRRPHKA